VPSEPLRLLLRVASLLEQLDIPYLVGGSMASSILGEPRATVDVDVAVRLPTDRVEALVEALGADFYVDRGAALDAVRRRASFNAIHQETALKVDFFVLGDTSFDREQLARRRASPVLDAGDRTVFVSSAEDLVLRKLEWYRAGNGVSDRQWRDVLGVLKVQAGRLELAYLRRWAAVLGLGELLERALRAAGNEGER
jgi:hypothetical protein